MPPRKRKAAEVESPQLKGKKSKANPPQDKVKLASAPSVPNVTIDVLPPSNESTTEDKAMLSLPPELVHEILKYYPEISVGSMEEKISEYLPVLGTEYLVRSRTLRSLSQVSKAYRNAFLPLLWETINICCCKAEEKSFYKALGDTMIRYATGLDNTPNLKPLIRNANLVFTRYQSKNVLPLFARCLESLPNLHTIRIIHTHSAMTTALKTGFENVTLSNVRRIIGPGNCHEILKRCPNVTTVWNTSMDGSTLIGVLKKHCPKVEELRGLYLDENMMKRITKAVPNLQVLEARGNHDLIIQCLPSFKQFHTIIKRSFMGGEPQADKAFINAFQAAFKKLPPIGQKRRILLYKDDVSSRRARQNKPGPLPRYYQEVKMDD